MKNSYRTNLKEILNKLKTLEIGKVGRGDETRERPKLRPEYLSRKRWLGGLGGSTATVSGLSLITTPTCIPKHPTLLREMQLTLIGKETVKSLYLRPECISSQYVHSYPINT